LIVRGVTAVIEAVGATTTAAVATFFFVLGFPATANAPTLEGGPGAGPSPGGQSAPEPRVPPLPPGGGGKERKDPFVIRVQAQGGARSQFANIGVPRAGQEAITVAEGLAALDELKSQLTKPQLEARATLFPRAERFIRNAAGGKGVGPPGRSFRLRGTNIRVDVEVLSGINFTR
jgi:hypothetical protein